MVFITDVLPWIISACTIYMFYAIGNKELKGWIISGVTQCLWLIYILGTTAWGLLPLNIAMFYMTGRNYLKWRKE